MLHLSLWSYSCHSTSNPFFFPSFFSLPHLQSFRFSKCNNSQMRFTASIMLLICTGLFTIYLFHCILNPIALFGYFFLSSAFSAAATSFLALRLHFAAGCNPAFNSSSSSFQFFAHNMPASVYLSVSNAMASCKEEKKKTEKNWIKALRSELEVEWGCLVDFEPDDALFLKRWLFQIAPHYCVSNSIYLFVEFNQCTELHCAVQGRVRHAR